MTVRAAPADIVSFWDETGPDKWFEHDEGFDQAIRLRFLPVTRQPQTASLRPGKKA